MSSIFSKLINLAGNIIGTLGVGNGGTGITSGTSGGVLAFTGSTTIASSGALTASAVVVGGGAGAAPSSLALGTANQVVGMNNAGTANEYKTIAVGTAGSDFAVALTAANAVTFNLPDAGASARGVITTGSQSIAGAKTLNGDTTVGAGTGTTQFFINAGAAAAGRMNFQQNGSTKMQWEMATTPDLSLNKDGGATVIVKYNYTDALVEFPSGEKTYTANFNTGLNTGTNNFTVQARKAGKTVTLTFPEMKATAGATTNTWSTSAAAITDAAWRPAVAVVVGCCIENNNSNVYTEPGYMIINTNGTFNLVRATNWTNATTNCGVNPLAVTYTTTA